MLAPHDDLPNADDDDDGRRGGSGDATRGRRDYALLAAKTKTFAHVGTYLDLTIR